MEKELKQIVYQLYKDLLTLFKYEFSPTYLIDDLGDIHFELQSLFRDERFEKIRCLESYKELISKLASINEETEEEIINRCSYGITGYFYNTLLDSLNKPTVKKMYVHNLEPVQLEEFPFDYESYSQALSYATSPSYLYASQGFYYRLLSGYSQVSNEILLIESGNIKIRKLNEYEKNALKARWHEMELRDFHNCEYAIVSEDKTSLADNNILNIIGLMRFFKIGNFRVSLLYELKKDIGGKMVMMGVGNAGNALKTGLYFEIAHGKLYSNDIPTYALTENEEVNFISFISKNHSRLSNHFLALSYISKLNGIEFELKIPILFFILESFFSTQSELTFKISLYSTKILNRDKKAFTLMKKLYEMRSKIAHGDEKGKDKVLKWLHTNNHIPTQTYKEVYFLTYNVVSDVFKEILDLEDIKPRSVVEYIENKLVND